MKEDAPQLYAELKKAGYLNQHLDYLEDRWIEIELRMMNRGLNPIEAMEIARDEVLTFPPEDEDQEIE